MTYFVLLTQIANAVQNMPYPRIQVDDEPEERGNRYVKTRHAETQHSTGEVKVTLKHNTAQLRVKLKSPSNPTQHSTGEDEVKLTSKHNTAQVRVKLNSPANTTQHSTGEGEVSHPQIQHSTGEVKLKSPANTTQLR